MSWKNLKKPLFLLISCLYLSAAAGCVPHHQLGERLIVQAIGVDFENDTFIITAKYLGGENPDGIKKSPRESLFVTEGRGSSISHALQEAGVNAGKPLILTDCQMFIIGQSLKSRPLIEILNVLVNEYEGYPNVTLTTTDNTAANLIKLMYKEESFSDNKYHQILAESRMLGFTPGSDLYTVVRNLSNSSNSAYLPILSITEAQSDFSDSGNYAIINGGAIYKNNFYIGSVNQETAAGVSFLLNTNISTSITVVYNGLSTLININGADIDINPKFTGEKLLLDIHYNVKASYSESRISFKTDHIEQMIKDAINSRITVALTAVLNGFGADVLGLEEIVRNRCYKEWKMLLSNTDNTDAWENTLKNCEFSIGGDVLINKYGIRW